MPSTNFRIYEFTDYEGGEDIWLTRISGKMDAELVRFWDRGREKPNLKPSGFLNHIVYFLTVGISRYNPALAKGLYSLIGVYTYKIKDAPGNSMVSSTFIPLPRGTQVTYIHTPSRLLTIDYSLELARRGKWTVSGIYFRAWRTVYYFLYRSSMSRCTLKISNSSNTKKRLLDFLSVRSTVLFPSQNTESFFSENPEKYFFYPSRFSPNKRQLFTVKAFENFCRINNEFELVLAGNSPNSKASEEYLETLKKEIAEKNLPVDIKVGLSREDIIGLYSRAYGCLFAGQNEDFGQVPIEAMAAGKPIISIKEGGPVETVLDQETGYLVSSPEEMAEAMLELARDPERAEAMGKKGHDYVVEKFSDETFISGLKKLIAENFQD